MRTLCRKSFAIGLLVAFLMVSMGRAVPVSALADPAPVVELAPVYETTIYQFSDYVDNLTEPQFEIFKIALGAYIAAQAGSQRYQLNDPYTTKDGVIGWLKSLGLQTYNSLIGFIPETILDPVTGGVMSTAPIKSGIKALLAYAMGAAVVAANYDSENNFINDIDTADNFYFKYSPDVQESTNYFFGVYDGMYQWQIQPSQFRSQWDWVLNAGLTGVTLAEYNSYLAQMTPPVVRNYIAPSNSGMQNSQVDSTWFATYNIIFIDTDDHKVKFVDAFGNESAYGSFQGNQVCYYPNSWGVKYYTMPNFVGNYQRTATYDPSNYTSYVDIAQDVFNQVINNFDSSRYFIQDFVTNVLAGPTFSEALPVEVYDDLNLVDGSYPYYLQLQNDYLFDIKGMINDLINGTDLYLPWYRNLYDLGGDLVVNPPVIQVNIDFDSLVSGDILPVNLNDIAEYTDNTYLDRVKEEARKFGDIFAAFIAFWHNVDYDLVYILFGCSITVLVGAFIGKWGHS